MVLAVFGLLVFGVLPASAATGGLKFVSSFNAPSPGFAEPYGIAVDQSDHDVYVADARGGSVVDVFNVAGVFQSTLTYSGFSSYVRGVAVNESTGNIYVANAVDTADSNEVAVHVFSASGVYETTWIGSNTPQESFGKGGDVYVAADNSKSLSDPSAGDVYVTSSKLGVVDKFDSKGNYLSQFTGSEAPGGSFGNLQGVAVDSSGDVYLVDQGSEVVDEYSPEGKYIRQLSGFSVPTSVAANGVNGDVYVVDSGSGVVDIFDSSDVLQAQIMGTTSEALTEPLGVAIDESTGNTYVSDAGPKLVDMFEAAPLAPAPNTDPPEDITGTSVTLHGDLNPGGVSTGYFFSYHSGADTNCLGSRTPSASAGAGGSDVHEEATVQGLAPATQYIFCFDAVVGGIARPGPAVQFTTPEVAPVVEEVSTSSVAGLAATLEAQVNPEKQDTTCKFEYGTSEAYGSSAACEPADLGNGFGARHASVRVTGLQSGTTYYYRVVAENAMGATLPSEGTGTFTTAAAQTPAVEEVTVSPIGQTTATVNATINPNVTTAAAQTPAVEEVTVSPIGQTTATVNATINPNGEETTCEIQYLEYAVFLETSWGTATSVPCPSALGEGFSGVNVSFNITGLAEGTEYRYRVLATNATGTEYGGGRFTTRPPAPAVTTGASSEVAQTTAAVTGTVNPETLPSTYYYQYGLNTEYGAKTPPMQAGEGALPVQAPATLEDLVPDTTYHYRLVAINEEGTSYGQDQTFTTHADPLPTLSTGPASGVSTNTATISGTINPQGMQASYWFEYGTSTSYGIQAFGAAGSGSENETVELSLSSLQPATTYHYRLVARGEGGTAVGEDKTFTTPAVLSQLIQPLTPPLLATPAIAFPTETTTTTKTTTKTLTRAQKLAKALKACKKQGKKRASCEKAARKHYGPVKKK